LESEHFQSLAQIIMGHARRSVSHDAIIFLERGESETDRVSYGQLDEQVDSLAAGLMEAGLAGAPVAIALLAGVPFVALFVACLRVGAVAIPAPFPDTDRSVDRLVAILADAQPVALVTDAAAAARLSKLSLNVRVLLVDELRGASGAPLESKVDPGQPAFVQYTSGSTREPRGVVITQGNLIANCRMIQVAFGLESTDVGVSWLPHFHDMGLIGTILQPLFIAGTAVLMPPRTFIQKPLRWLRAIQKYGSTIAGAPSFAYELCTRMISPEAASTLDLSSWRVAFCGAEPVRASVLEKFGEHFAVAGFRAQAFLPCYGLAETTLIASATAAGSGVAQREIVIRGSGAFAFGRKVVGCGGAVDGGSIILRSENEVLAASDDRLGEICVGGPHVSPGHWNGSDRSIASFPNVFEYRGLSYLPTGDIGALVAGELFPVDRISDVIVMFGANIHAADIEATVMDDALAIEISAAIAFSADDGCQERVVLLCELDRRSAKAPDLAAFVEQLRKRVAEAHGVVPLVGLTAYGALPRTSSGKVQRAASKKKLLSAQLRLIMVDDETAIAFSKLHGNADIHAEHSV
jgi:acyl-CoA synthetase (AMP-forming)/AMP-acid ligase II